MEAAAHQRVTMDAPLFNGAAQNALGEAHSDAVAFWP